MEKTKDLDHLTIKTTKINKKFKSFRGATQYVAKFIPKLSERTGPMRKLLKKEMEWQKTAREREDFNEFKKSITEIPCLAHFARDRVNIVTTDASRTGLGITLWKK